MRTVINVRAGGRTPISGAMHSVILLGVVLGAGQYAEHIPIGVLAGILMKSGIDILDVTYLKRLPTLPVTSVFTMVNSLPVNMNRLHLPQPQFSRAESP